VRQSRPAGAACRPRIVSFDKLPNGAQRIPNGRPVGPNLQLNAKPLGSVGAMVRVQKMIHARFLKD